MYTFPIHDGDLFFYCYVSLLFTVTSVYIVSFTEQKKGNWPPLLEILPATKQGLQIANHIEHAGSADF